MLRKKKLLIFIGIFWVSLIFITGCNDTATSSNQSNLETEQEKENGLDETKEQETVGLTAEEKAFQAILKDAGLNYDDHKIREITQEGKITVNNEYIIGALDPVTINNKKFFKFEQVSLGKGTASAYLVSAETNRIYNDFYEGILQEFDLKSLDFEKVFDRKLYILTEQSPQGTNLIYIDEMTNKVYYDLDSAKMEIMAVIFEEDPLLNLVGKNSTEVEKATGKPLQIETQEVIDEFGEVYYMDIKFIDYNGARIHFHKDGSFDQIGFTKGASSLGIKEGMTFKDIKNIFGTPSAEFQDPSWGDYVLSYDVHNNKITFYAETANGPFYYISIK